MLGINENVHKVPLAVSVSLELRLPTALNGLILRHWEDSVSALGAKDESQVVHHR